ncbi:putative ABC transport system ATP-binding protein/macrolide transport system ATP-binding/permease protein/lipoprotein-releasing system ATP-binding protein [Verrucomicrobium sp. GAS474]|uniref:ABC transporter ATP-binding protein n=1 Tax=Verrucomicrobium sp. GAS474 TaxID=1882831 RepID=UPI00087A2BA9|nr:ABC transporter ATP-binding protein [Verrucomicrobium sp. GAS474]SDU24321.1 putative ABC transport system ATP-binding protein/macrolide transport system ATP-binding/permease protein/lipoprotein-releasing system ATP-binding protein [Verrucomicrobium sp. GAS474]
MSNPLIEARGIGKTYRMGSGTVPVLSGIDLTIAPGDFLTICGASGSGKSTLLQILGGLQRPDSGELLWRGEATRGWSRARIAAWRGRQVGFVFQSYQLLPEFSAVENVDLPAVIRGEGDREASLALLRGFGLAERAEHRPNELSGGEQQRVALARALRNRPSLILADEPTGSLDRETGREILRYLTERVARPEFASSALVVVTHDPEIAALGARRVVVEGGKLRET